MQENQRKSNLDEVVEDIKVTKNEFNEKIEQIARESEEIKKLLLKVQGPGYIRLDLKQPAIF